MRWRYQLFMLYQMSWLSIKTINIKSKISCQSETQYEERKKECNCIINIHTDVNINVMQNGKASEKQKNTLRKIFI